MLLKHGSRSYELLDEWWLEAGMQGFRRRRESFRALVDGPGSLPVIEVPVASVEPLVRQSSHGVFNDSPEFGTARDRVVSILRAFRGDVPLEPIELVRAPAGSLQPYKLWHGAHRFYCAIAAGFTAVPARDVTDELAKL